MSLFSILIYLANYTTSSLWSLFGPSILTGVVVTGGVIQLSSLGLLGDSSSPEITKKTEITYSVKFSNAIPIAAQDSSLRNVTEFRVIVDQGTPKRAVKYISVSHDVRRFAVGESTYSNTSVISMPLLPTGDWVTADIALNPDGNQIVVTGTSYESLPSVSETWHPYSFDILDLEIENVEMPHSTDRVKLVSHPKLNTPGHLAVMKYSPFPDSIGIGKIDVETEMYHYLERSTLTPKFLGHVKENNQRVIGFLLEYIDGARPADSHGYSSDLALNQCVTTLKILHKLRVAHGDSHPGNCLLRKDGIAVFIDFEFAIKSSNPRDLEAAFERDLALMDLGRLKVTV
ncbi:hypothetical protein O1611_g2509 [Lasiodiplodia mahajangana]|uniref:Uncharacterized protein n=1 Tax=Lasiodiplodia mahajangana TaxID=1108764 RepID=A0ACC2JUP7_9PEZI|nr:hypothetical protein O1611_g2509 [Lasiodiplodia mahajangana]